MELSNKRMGLQVLIIVVLSFIFAIAAKYVYQLIALLVGFHRWIGHMVGMVFSSGGLGLIIENTLAFLVVPFLIAAIVAIIYKIVKKKFLPVFMLVVWVLWLVLATAIIVHVGTAAS